MNCPTGFHCVSDSAGGKCDTLCTTAGNECGDGYLCTTDGRCISAGNGGGGGGGGGGGDVDAFCPAVDFTPTVTTPTVELLLDQSGTMDARYGDTDRWNAMRNALIDPTTGVVATLAKKVVFGATLYSSRSMRMGNRDVGVEPCPLLASTEGRAIDNFTAIQKLLQGADPIADTPTAESIDAIVKDFADHPPAQGSPPIIVLATDGLPDTCADANPPAGARQEAANATSVTAAQNAFKAGIKLFFLFVGDDEAGTHPQEMANAGAGLDPKTGNAQLYVATDPAQLAEHFQTIIGGVVSCDIKLNGKVEADNAATGVVTLNGTRLTFMTDWTLDPSGSVIHLIGNACATLKASATPAVKASFDCGGAVIF
jgi:hypothetical protein